LCDLKHDVQLSEEVRASQNMYILKLRGSIRVFLRVKPMPADPNVGSFEDLQNQCTVKVPKPLMQKEALRQLFLKEKATSSLKKANSSTKKYQFDNVFDQNSTQEEVFNEIKPLIQCSLDGKNSCVFAYGQTGSGKTFTMEGAGALQMEDAFEVNSLSGVLPRTAAYLFQELNKLSKRGTDMQIQVSSVEIYNENIKDLLNK